MDMLKCCLNPRVLIGAGVVGVGIVLLAPNLLAAALPTLLVLICPVSMLVMMVGMGKMGSSKNVAQTVGTDRDYACPLHAAVRSGQPGRCSQCGMTLVASAPPAGDVITADDPSAAVSREAQLGLLRAQLQVLGEQQAAVTARMAQLQQAEAAGEPASKALQQAEQVVEAAAHRH
jgi:heavy metal-binding protein/DUF2933 family protein